MFREAWEQGNVKNSVVESYGEFIARETTIFWERLLMQKYPELKFRSVFPIVTEGGFGSKFQSKMYNFTGDSQTQAEVVNNIPLVTAYVNEQQNPVLEEVLGMSWDYSELRAVQQYQPYVEFAKLAAVRRGLEYKLNRLALFGREEAGVTGLLNNLTINRIYASGTGSAMRWVNKTPDQRLDDVMNGYLRVNSDSEGVFNAKQIYMSNTSFNQMIRPRSAFSDYTVKNYAQDNLPDLQVIIPDAFLNLQGRAPGGGDNAPSNMMIFMDKETENFLFHLPVEMLATPVNYSGKQLIQPFLTRSSGLNVIRSPSILIMDGI
jgi:hypothetical protein